MQRVLILGSPGAGKSILARALAQQTGLPLIHLDQLYWLPGWIEQDKLQWRENLSTVLAGEQWIIDGTYGSTLDLRLRFADTAILLDYPTHLCLYRSLKRVWTTRGTREDMASGCPERIHLQFLFYVLTFRRRKLPGVRKQLANFGGTVLTIHQPSRLKELLASLK